MKRLPLIPTLIVAAAIAVMIGLGVWQLQRRSEKEALLAQYAANRDLPVMSFPRAADPAAMFRRSSLFCLEVVRWDVGGAGKGGYRHIAQCRTGAEGALIPVDMGSIRDPGFRPQWRGGDVTGTITEAPSTRSVLGDWLAGSRETDRPLMLVSETPAPGLAASPRPDPANVPNNHLAYAGQWFFFALVAAIIYFLALRARATKLAAPRPGG
ncbi:SURF1 family protein [Sphingomonas sp. BGYR3]|uniref:SURF1 family protein n=1 Tax=Sphingomonas sp. BGYR3 TaxID=2975483 RepID=UPI0021A73E60|nr:SURF1 family protein [Sphingomonas sp. BGYR3]